MAKIALLIGVSEYEPELNPLPAAVKDVKAMQRVLQDPEIGGFDEIKTLTNPDLQEMQRAIETLFSTGRSKDDLLLLFFSGHGIKDDTNKLFFATRITGKNDKGELLRSTAVPAQFVHDVMNNSRAKRQAVILDCCFSGAFDPSLQAKDDGSFDLQGQLGAEGRVVLASSSSTQYSFEQKGEDLSIYTRYLVEGIETGAGDHNKDGQVSILELHEYATRKVQEKLPNVTPKIIVLKDKGFEIILAKSKTKINPLLNVNNNKIDLGEINLEKNKKIGSLDYYNPIPSLLQSLSPFIERLIEHFRSHYLSQIQNNASLNIANTNSILEIIRLASDAEFIFLMNSSQDKDIWKLKSQSLLSEEIDEAEYTEIIKTKILSTISTEFIFTTVHHGVYRIFHDEKTLNSKAFLLIPLDSDNYIEFMVVCGLSNNSPYLNDAYTNIIASFYKATNNSHLQPSRVEADILDDLKCNYGFLPISFYNKRFELFCDRLSQIVIHFEPILDLRKTAITRWEALARDPESLTAPVDLFDAAELWGRKFTVQLDIELLKLAAKSYRRAGSEAKRNRPDEISPLSVNVYPESLMRTVYFDTVRQITTPDEKGYTLLPADSLVLEISEKADLPAYNDGVRLRSPLQAFKEKLRQYTQELEIQFGIDDFGVGYASVSRLAGLKPPYVKIDRDILHQQQVDIIIRFVREIVARSSELHLTKIIVEGLDEYSPINLYQLQQLGVAYVQGYIIGKAGPNIYRLPPEKYESLRKLIQGDSV
ncbi:MAG: caspase family protein [Nostoc sp. LLA-1]|nr:caspase family protein [Cyanocohniella sp. LLY]